MKQLIGRITFKIKDGVSTPYANALDAEVYLNGEVSTEIFRRFGVHIRVHIKDGAKAE